MKHMYSQIENQPLIFRTVRAIMFINQSIINLPADDKTAKASGYRIGVHGKPEMEDKTMEKKNLDWGNIGFSYVTTDYRYVSNYKDGKWDEGTLTEDPNVVINECAGILQYCQECFEGLKAYNNEDGSIVTFRQDLNA